MTYTPEIINKLPVLGFLVIFFAEVYKHFDIWQHYDSMGLGI